MTQSLRFLLVLHNHQPVGNFDGVFEQAYQDSYLPFLDVFESYPSLRIALHTSGSLMEWLDEHHSEYVDRLAGLVATGRVEIVGGPFYEPILTMIPSRDRIGQIRRYSQFLADRLGAKVRGMWMPERVWEQSLTADLAEAGLQYTLLDDFHFKNAGLDQEQLFGYYLTEDDGRVLSIFPGSEKLRYLIPFESPQASIDYLWSVAQRHPGSVIVFADDGEKFGTWPETKQHVYDRGWLRQFFDLLVASQDWLKLTTPAEALDHVRPLDRVYLPEGSYREMTEWVLPTERILEHERLKHDLEETGRWHAVSRFVRGGYWRNFKVKYPEANEMYARMMQVSQRLADTVASGVEGETLDSARRELYRGQCNCSYWHGAFGGLYLPHLRNAVFNHLIAADNLLDQATGRGESWVETRVEDFNFDARQEVELAADKLIAWLAPAAGGMLYELDVRSICLNLLATMNRRPEAYHQKVLAGGQSGADQAASIHDRVVFKQPGLDERLQYDREPRKCLLDRFYELGVSQAEVAAGTAVDAGDFVASPYEAVIRRNPDRIQVRLTRDGHVGQHPVRIVKGITLEAGSSELVIAYRLENLPKQPLHFAVEFNFAALPDGADDRYFHDGHGKRLGKLGSHLDLVDAEGLSLTDEWLGIDVGLALSRPGGVWTFPIATVSQSEGGFELVHQSVVVQPHWIVQPDAQGAWSVTLTLSADTTLAESRRPRPAALASHSIV